MGGLKSFFSGGGSRGFVSPVPPPVEEPKPVESTRAQREEAARRRSRRDGRRILMTGGRLGDAGDEGQATLGVE